MTRKAASHPHLYALIGDVALDVPPDIAREIECALQEQNLPAQAPTFLTCLEAIRQANGADGRPCTGQTLGAEQQASLSRSLGGLEVILDLVQAAVRARMDGAPEEHLGDFHTDGLIVAARQLVREAHHSLSHATA